MSRLNLQEGKAPLKKQSSQVIAVVLAHALLLAPARAQQTQAQKSPPPAKPPSASAQQNTPYEDEVVRITSNLVQVDATVTDTRGKPVTDLRAEDFEVLEDGKPQHITNLSYIALDARQPGEAGGTTTAVRPPATNSSEAVASPPPTAVRLRPGEVRRTLALVIDDLGLSFESIASARASLKKFVDEQVRAGDLVAIIRTSAGVGALQQFTSDKRALYAAIERVRWYPPGRGGVSAFAAIEKDVVDEANRTAASLRANSTNGASNTGITPAANVNLPDQSTSLSDLRDTNDLTDRYREELFASGTLGALNFVVRGLKELPGRKSVILFSDSLPVFRKDGKSERILETLRRLTDLANRASVVIYSIDARGLQTLSLTATDNTSSMTSSAQIQSASDERNSSYFESQNGLNYLAQQTGGMFIHSTNDLAEGVRLAIRDQQGYYLIGYRPDESTFDQTTGAPRFHELTVRVTRPDLKVRTRNGFYGFTEAQAHPALRTRAEQLSAAITSPFSSGDLPVRLTSLFGNDRKAGSFLRSLLYLDARRLTFTKEPDGSYKSAIDVLALTFSDRGQVINQVDRTDTLSVEEKNYENVLRYGLIYILNVPIRQAGAYQLRLAVRDTASERIGSASQYVEVPDIGEDRLLLSGIILSGNDLPAAADAATYTGNLYGGAQANQVDPQAGPAIRRIRRGTELFYNFAVYNARVERTPGGQPNLQTQVRMYRDGRLLYIGKRMPVEVGQQTDMGRLLAGGRMKLSAQATPGEYVLQIVVTDLLDSQKPRVASQWIDFEIVE